MDGKKNSPDQKQESTDADLFRQAVGDVRPIEHDRVLLDANKPEPVPRQTLADEESVLQQMESRPFLVDEVETGDELSFLRAGIQKQTLRKLKRGLISIQDELDLHGMFVKQARTIVQDYISRCVNRGIYAVRIIHGKGLGSKDKYPVLKNNLNKWLQLNDNVLAFCSARPVDGGTGAVYVLLKRTQNNRTY